MRVADLVDKTGRKIETAQFGDDLKRHYEIEEDEGCVTFVRTTMWSNRIAGDTAEAEGHGLEGDEGDEGDESLDTAWMEGDSSSSDIDSGSLHKC